MRVERPLRVPLQIGTSALSSLVLTAAFFAPGSVLVVGALTVLSYFGIDDRGEVGSYLLLPGFFVCGLAWKHLLRVRSERPSDLLLTADGFEVRGGPSSGRRIKWTEVAKVTIEQPKKKDQKSEDDSDLRQLLVCRRDSKTSERILLAAADRPSEQRSLTELARMLEAGRGARPEYANRIAAKEDAIALLLCPACGAAVAPADAATVACAYCQATVTVRDEVRTRLRNAADVARRPDAAVAKLLDQPGAGFLSSIFAVATLFVLGAWPAAVALATLNYMEHAFTIKGAAYLLLFVVAGVLGCFGLLRGRLVDRQALRLVALDFGAIPPAGPDKSYLCRQCLAPLQARSEQVLVSCVYCQAENVLGIDLRRDAKVARKEASSLADALRRRASERRRWRGVSLAGIALLALAAYSLRHGVEHNEVTWPLEERCDQGDLESCVALAELISNEGATSVRVNPRRAVKLYLRACEGHLESACARLSADCSGPYPALPCRPDPSGAGYLLRPLWSGIPRAVLLFWPIELGGLLAVWLLSRFRPRRPGPVLRVGVSADAGGLLIIERQGGFRIARRLSDGAKVAFDAAKIEPPTTPSSADEIDFVSVATYGDVVARLWLEGGVLHGLQPQPETPLEVTRGSILVTRALLATPTTPLPVLVLHSESNQAGAAEVLTYVEVPGTTRWKASFPQPTLKRAKYLYVTSDRLWFVLTSGLKRNQLSEALALDATTGAVRWRGPL